VNGELTVRIPVLRAAVRGFVAVLAGGRTGDIGRVGVGRAAVLPPEITPK
jgi:predicted methyltransferase MtxX (methanogen marker protein 4)